MQNLLHSNGCTLFVGAQSEHQSTVAHEAVFDALVHGANIVALVETKGDIEAARAYARLWLRARERSPEHLDRVHGLANWRQHPDPTILADEIMRAARRSGHGDLVVFSDRALDLLACQPGDHRVGVCADLADWLPDARIVVSAHTGHPALPPPRFATYRADRIWRVQTSDGQRRITVNEVKRGSEKIVLQPRNLPGGILTLETMEPSHA